MPSASVVLFLRAMGLGRDHLPSHLWAVVVWSLSPVLLISHVDLFVLSLLSLSTSLSILLSQRPSIHFQEKVGITGN